MKENFADAFPDSPDRQEADRIFNELAAIQARLEPTPKP